MASYFKSYFETSSMSKRLIQYALSKLEIFETDALDLENLDIAWRKNTTIEFKNVGLRLKRVETLLQLPSSLELVKADVLLIRLTIPVDIYNRPVVVEIDGLEGHLRAKARAEQPPHHVSRADHDWQKKRSSTKSSVDGTAHTMSNRRKRNSGAEDDEVPDGTLPTATDLAESFLQTESEEEKAELKAAMLSETQEFGSSSVLSDDGEGLIGTGTALSLPRFVATFLQGIADRLEVRVRNVTMNLDIDLPYEIPKTSVSNTTDPVTFQLRIDKVDVEGVTHSVGKVNKAQPNPHKPGKRLISLATIRGFLISEANFFSSLAGSSAMSSPSATHSDVFDDGKFSRSDPSVRESIEKTSNGSYSPEQIGSSVSSRRLSVGSLSRSANDIDVLSDSIITSHSGRFDDAPEDETTLMPTSIHAGASEIGESALRNSGYIDQVTDSQYLENNNREEGDNFLSPLEDNPSGVSFKSALSTPRASTQFPNFSRTDATGLFSTGEDPTNPMLQSTILPSRPNHRFSAGRVSHSQSSLQPSSLSGNDVVSDTTTEGKVYLESTIDSDHGGPPLMAEDDLIQSRLFSHEEAESMYMSAISRDSSPSGMPGGWANSSNGSKRAISSPDSPSFSTLNVLDNLEHARRNSASEDSKELDVSQTSHSALGSSSISRKLSFSTPVALQNKRATTVLHGSSNISERSGTSSGEYSRLTKEIMRLDRVDIYIPSTEDNIDSSSPDTASLRYNSEFDDHFNFTQSTSVNVPGAFSNHLPNLGSSIKPSASKPEPKSPEPRKEPLVSDTVVELLLGQLLLQFDISVGRLVFRLVHQLKDLFQKGSPTKTSSATQVNQAEGNFLLNAGEISIRFLERLEGNLIPIGVASEPELPSLDILLQTSIIGLQVGVQRADKITKTSLSIGKFSFGYAQENILSFDANLQMRASVRDLKATEGIDISVSITQSSNTTRCEITTLPLHVSIDLQRLDETFNWFGGLSGVWNLGSSIASNATITAISPGKEKTRGVHFETPIRPEDKSVMAQNKANLRIGGFILDLVGRECSIGVETSAVKIVSRNEGIGLSIQKARVSGPHLKVSDTEPAIVVEVISTHIEYLAAPMDTDLDRLLSLITPSKAKFDEDDDILIDTLLRQRKQGSVVRLTVDNFQARLSRLHELSYLPELGEEVSRLSTVAKYLPDDDRPGLLSLIMVRKFDAHVDFAYDLGIIQLSSNDIEVAQITFPSLIAFSVDSISAHRNVSEELLGIATDPESREPRARVPAIMARMIGDEMEPVVKIKLWNLKIEYRVTTLLALMGIVDNVASQDISASLSTSVATLTDLARKGPNTTLGGVSTAGTASSSSKSLTIDVVLRDCILALNPLGHQSKVLVVLTEAHLSSVLPKDDSANASMELNKASVLVIDNVANLNYTEPTPRRQSFDGGSVQVSDLCGIGYVSVSYISSAKAILQMSGSNGARTIDVELRDDLFVLESCADSTQTLIAALNNLSLPTPPSKETKYRTKVIPVQDLLASLSGDAFGTAEGAYDLEDDFGIAESAEDFPMDDGDFGLDSQYYQEVADDQYDEKIVGDEGGSASQLTTRDTQDGVLLESFAEPAEIEENEELNFDEDHFGTGSVLEGTAHRWNSAKNTYDRSNPSRIRESPLKVCIRDVHIIWNLFDGYDWQHTRETITKAVQEVESKAIEKRARNERWLTFEQDIEDEETVIGDFLFNSIYIGIPANRDPRELAAAINQDLNDTATETESVATTMASSSPRGQDSSRRSKSKKLRLNRSKHHKITFELRGVNVDLVVFPPGTGETQSSVDVRVRDFEVFDHVPTSTWRKFVTYMQDAGERETGASMVHIEILNVKPLPDLAASEIVLKATVLPLRLHVDQDALDFITRFFEFKDDSAPIHNSPGDVPFIQRAEVNSVKVKLDFKPKRVDYAGLRSGHTTEFMNFLILDEADMELRHTIIYGVSGFDKLGQCLNDIWMPDIKRNQLGGILAGLAPVRSLVNVGGGFQQLVTVPIREYKKDGRIVRSISRGAAAFAKTTGTEVVKLGAKVAVGVQTVLQGVEELLAAQIEPAISHGDGDDSEEDSKQISLYANQPVGVLQGLRGGYNGLQRDLFLARDAIIAVPGEAMESGTAAGVLQAVRKHAPVVILRPVIGVAKAGGQILMGATNSLDPVNLKRADAKYKKH